MSTNAYERAKMDLEVAAANAKRHPGNEWFMRELEDAKINFKDEEERRGGKIIDYCIGTEDDIKNKTDNVYLDWFQRRSYARTKVERYEETFGKSYNFKIVRKVSNTK